MKPELDNSIALISRIREKANSFLMKELRKIGLKGIVPSHGHIFTVLFKNKELTMTEIANEINRDRSTVTTLIKKLIKLGYVDSRSNPEDKRSNLIFLTINGKEFEDKFLEISEELYKTEYKGISEEKREFFLEILNKIDNNFS